MQGHDCNRCDDRAALTIHLSVEPTIRTVIRSPAASEIYPAARTWEPFRQEYDSTFSLSGRIDTQSWCALDDAGAAAAPRTG